MSDPKTPRVYPDLSKATNDPALQAALIRKFAFAYTALCAEHGLAITKTDAAGTDVTFTALTEAEMSAYVACVMVPWLTDADKAYVRAFAAEHPLTN